LRKQQYNILLVCHEVYRQQAWMYQNKTNKIEDRIVSLTQPHIRPIIRGKAGKHTEFGAKLSASSFEWYVFLDRISWDNFNQSEDLIAQVEAFKEFTGSYPESVHVNQIYRTHSNQAWCKERGIRMSAPPLGRRPAHVSKSTKQQAKKDERTRQAIEGKFGQAKRRFNLALSDDQARSNLPNNYCDYFFSHEPCGGIKKIILAFFVSISLDNHSQPRSH